MIPISDVDQQADRMADAEEAHYRDQAESDLTIVDGWMGHRRVDPEVRA